MKATRLRLVLVGSAAVSAVAACSVLPGPGPLLSDPGLRAVCVHVIDAACALQASQLSGHLVGWIPVTTSQDFAQWLVLQDGHVVEKLYVGSVNVSVESPSLGVLAAGTPSPYRWDDNIGMRREQDAPGGIRMVSITWQRGSVGLHLSMEDAGLDASQERSIAQLVRYAQPK